MDKPTLLIINNYIWSVDNPDVRIRYELLSERYQGLMLYLSHGSYDDVFADFRCCSSPYSTSLKRAFSYTFFCLRMAKSLRRVNAIIVYDPLLPGLVGYLLKLLSGAPLVVEINTFNVVAMKLNEGSVWSRFKNFLVPLVTRLVLSKADAVKFVSATLRAEVEGSVELSGKVVANFSDFVPTALFVKTLPDACPYILTVGYPYHIKGVDVLIRAFNLVSGEFPEVRLRVIGACHDLSPYRELAGDNSAIDFYPGLPYAELVPHFQGSLFFVLASRTEGLPRVLIEAMASGKALIGSNVGGIPELVEEGVNGFLFDMEDHHALADRMRSLLSDEGLRTRMGEASYRKVRNDFTAREYMDRYHALISQVIEMPASAVLPGGVGR